VVSNVPAKVLINKLSSPFEWVQLVLLAIVIFLISEGVWRFSVKRYTSASS
jgi:ABC-type uncharacterized transport system permease subunit